MASSFVVTADLRLDPRSINSSAKQVKQALGRITGQASEFQKSLDASTARVFAFGATTTVLAGVSTAFRSLVKSTIDVEKRLVEINAIFQQSEAVMNSFRDAIFQVAQTTGQTFSTVADAAGELARQGLSAEETASRLQDALILTRISGLGAEDSVKTLTAAINGFTSAALTATQVTNKIVAVDTAFAVSAQDLAQGLARAGSTAEDAGVSFDQLLGLITAVEQRTARGGAVIGNAFKSIFTRLSRGSTIDDLRSLGVEIDASQSGVQKLQALSNALENIADPTVASKIKELAGGVFQINVVSATLKDLANDTGVFKKATQEAAQASDDAYKRNEQLNKSISAQINSLIVGLTNLAEKIGSVTFGPLLTNLIGVASKITETFNNLLNPEQGNDVAKAFFKGIGAFISGPGLVLITAAFIKIVRLVSKFALEGFKAVLQIGSATEKVKQIEGGIVQLLSQDENLRKVIASTTASQAQKEQAVINAIKAENSLLLQQEALVRSIANLAARKGVTGFSSGGGFTSGSKRFSGGYVPNFARNDFQLEEAEARALGASSSVRAKMSKGKIGGKRFIMNNQETELPNFGKNGDSAVIPSYAKGYIPSYAKGYIPNFAGRGIARLIKPADYFKQKNATLAGFQNGVANGQIKAANFQKDQKIGGVPFSAAKVNAASKKGLVLKNREAEKQKKNEGPVKVRQIAKGLLPTILTPNSKDGGKITTTRKGTDSLRPLIFDFPVKGFGRKKKLDIRKQFTKDFDAEALTNKAKNKALSYANQVTKVLGKPKQAVNKIEDTDRIKGFTGAVRSAAGAIFDAALTTALNIKGGQAGEGTSGASGGDFDIRGNVEGLGKFFAGRVLPSKGAFLGLGDFKFSAKGATSSMKSKSLTELRENQPAIFDKLRKKPLLSKNTPTGKPTGKSVGKAAGYVPNFAGGNDALSAAISREKAAGLPMHKIRVDQSNRLINSKNPAGLAVTNTRDEPRGLKDVFASGYIPNFALPQGVVNVADLPSSKAYDAGLKEAGKGLKNSAAATNKLNTSLGGAASSVSGTKGSFDSLNAEAKSTNSFLKIQGAAFAASTIVAYAGVAATKAANVKRKEQIDVIKKSVEAEKRNINASNKSAEAKLDAIAAMEKKAQAEIQSVEATKSFYEKTTDLVGTIANVGISLASLKSLGGGKFLKGLTGGINKIGGKVGLDPSKPFRAPKPPKLPSRGNLTSRGTIGLAKNAPASGLGKKSAGIFARIAGSKIGKLGGSLFARVAGIGLSGVFAAGATTLVSVLGAWFAGKAIGNALENADLNPIRFILGQEQKSKAEETDRKTEKADNFQQERGGRTADLKSIIATVNLDAAKGIKLGTVERTEQRPIETTIGQDFANVFKGDFGSNTKFETVKTRELDTNFDVSGAYKEQLAKQGINLPEIDSKKVDAAFATYSKAVDKAGSDFARDKIDGSAKQKLIEKETKILQDKLKILENGGTAKLEADIAVALAGTAKNAFLINKKYQEIAGNSQAISDNQYLIANASKVAADRINKYASLVPEEFAEFAGTKALTSNIGLDVNQKKRNLEGARGTRDALAVAARGKPQGSSEAEDLASAEADVSKAKGELTAAGFDATASILGSLKDTAAKIKSLGGPAFEEAFNSIEKAQASFLVDPTEANRKAVADGLTRLSTINIPKEIKIRQEANAIASSGALLGSATLAQSGVPDVGAAVLGLKQISSSKVGSQEREDQLVKIEPILEAIKDKLGPEIFGQVLKTGGFQPKEFQKEQQSTAASAFKRNLKQQGGLDDSSINKLTKQFEERLAEQAKDAEKFPNPEKLNEEFANLEKSTNELNTKLLSLSEEFPDTKRFTKAIGELSTKAETAGAAFDGLAVINETISGFSAGAEGIVAKSKEGIERLQVANEAAIKSVEGLEKNQAALAQTIKTLQVTVLALADGLK